MQLTKQLEQNDQNTFCFFKIPALALNHLVSDIHFFFTIIIRTRLICILEIMLINRTVRFFVLGKINHSRKEEITFIFKQWSFDVDVWMVL